MPVVSPRSFRTGTRCPRGAGRSCGGPRGGSFAPPRCGPHRRSGLTCRGGCEELERLVAEITMIPTDGARRLRPWRGAGGELGCLFLAGVGQLEDAAAAVSFDGTHQPLVLELLQRGVDGSGTCPPRAFAAAFELLDDLVSVRLLLGEEHEDRRADVAAGRTPARTEVAGRSRLLDRRMPAAKSGASKGGQPLRWRPRAPVSRCSRRRWWKRVASSFRSGAHSSWGRDGFVLWSCRFAPHSG